MSMSDAFPPSHSEAFEVDGVRYSICSMSAMQPKQGVAA